MDTSLRQQLDSQDKLSEPPVVPKLSRTRRQISMAMYEIYSLIVSDG